MDFKDIISQAELSSIDKIVYLALLSLMDKRTSSCQCKVSDLRINTGYISNRSIGRSIKHLEKFKYIKKVRKAFSCIYHILPSALIIQNKNF